MFETKFLSLNVYTAIAIFFIALGIYYNDYPWWYLFLIIAVYMIVLILGVVKIQWNFFIKSLNSLPILYYEFKKGQINLANRNKQVVLTFDDGPHEATTIKILDILKSKNVPAVFFVIGKNLACNPEIGKRIVSEGHQIGNHTYNHSFNFDWASAKTMQNEIEQTNELIETITGEKTIFFRPPYGVTNPNVAKAIKAVEMKSIGWSVRSLDTVAKDEDKLLQKILKQTKSGSIILLHDTCEITVKILPKLIDSLRQRGFDFVRIP